MSLRTGLALALLGGCGDVAALAEPPPEPTAWAAGEAFAGALRFADGRAVGAATAGPSPARPGAPLVVRFAVDGAADGLRVGLRAPRAAGRQVVAGQSRRAEAPREDPRDRWVTASVEGGVATAELPVPADWHARHAVVVLDVGAPAVAGPRQDRGAGVLAVVPVATRPTRVTAARAAVVVDGALDEWEGPGTALVESLEGEPDPAGWAADPAARGLDALAEGRGTVVRFAWDDEWLYVGASLPDADLWSDYAAQDDPLYKQEAFELFVAAGGDGTNYLEYQVSARGVTFDARFPRHRAGDEGWDSGWRTAVAVHGSVDDARGRDLGWTVEAALPWAELCGLAALACPPAPGMRLRVNAFRLERPDRKRTDALALSPTRAPDFHAWGNAAELELR
jgi:hypothetical protein